jgi:hypothetical protein
MKNLGRASRVSRQNHLRKLLTTEFHDPNHAYDLFDEFLRHKAYNNKFCLKLIAIAKQRSRVTWEVRRLAVLMLEHQILKLDPDDLDAFDLLLTELNLKQGPGLNKGVVPSVLKEGYSSTELFAFVPEFRSKLLRLNRVHDKIKGRRTSAASLREFVGLSRRNCKLSLARYLFTPEDIVDEIVGQLQITDGLEDLDVSQPSFIEEEIKHAMNLLPDFEAEILKRLCENSNIYWVSEMTSCEINSLVEYPATTVVLVIKPPGSDIEFEIKRAGRKGRNSLNVVFDRDGYTVSPSHRLDGGCMQWLLRYEAESASRLGLIYRLVHGTEAPIPKYISRSTIYAVPSQRAEVKTLMYFTEPEFFGERFHEMRIAMEESVAAFLVEGNGTPPDFPGDLGLTAQFMGQVSPAQAILCGTSSFRLDKLAAYLADSGPETYFAKGLGVAYTKQDGQQLADELLEEILGVYHPPDVRYETYGQYLKAAFGVAENRARANRVYLSLGEQIATFWGTLLGVRGHSRGESFVARNVGLKSLWDKGQWKVRIIFMDHDALSIPDPQDKNFYATSGIPTMALDESYIWGRKPHQFATSELGYLQRIYRVGRNLDAKGQALAQVALQEAYGKTRHELLTNQELRALFSKQFLERLLDWDTIVGGYFQRNNHKSANTKWKKEMQNMLTAKGYRRGAFDTFIVTIEKNRAFLETYSFLFDVGRGANK